jgi:hypothetical protein
LLPKSKKALRNANKTESFSITEGIFYNISVGFKPANEKLVPFIPYIHIQQNNTFLNKSTNSCFIVHELVEDCGQKLQANMCL